MKIVITVALIGAWVLLEMWWWRQEKRFAAELSSGAPATGAVASKHAAMRKLYYVALVGLMAAGVWWATTCGWSPA